MPKEVNVSKSNEYTETFTAVETADGVQWMTKRGRVRTPASHFNRIVSCELGDGAYGLDVLFGVRVEVTTRALDDEP